MLAAAAEAPNPFWPSVTVASEAAPFSAGGRFSFN